MLHAKLHRRRLLQFAAALMIPAASGFNKVFAGDDPRPEFSARDFDEALMFYFGTSDAADDGSIRIDAPLITTNKELLPFKISAPGAEKIAVLTDANPQPLIMAMDQIREQRAVIVGRARIQRAGTLNCYAMRNGVLGRASLQVGVAGHWRVTSQ